MSSSGCPRVIVLALGFAVVLTGCAPASPPQPEWTTTTRPVGTWQGRGNKTVGDVMLASGRFRVTWQTRAEDDPGGGTFRLIARSSVSGRPLQEIADHRGEGQGTLEISGEDDRRIYDFTVESDHIEWSFTVEDVVVIEQGGAPGFGEAPGVGAAPNVGGAPDVGGAPGL